ncbi:MAG TPA: hypothetical protein VLJ15_00125 [Gammaproteobacteria bacterium]|nr:hypothetical protein [Gammaproteobacteria bacterium]
MKIKFFILASAILSTGVFANEGQVISNYQIPFYNVDIQPGNKIRASYNFDQNHQILVCTTGGLTSLVIEWPYKGKEYLTSLPAGGHKSFKGNWYPEGYFVDSKGLVTISNEKSVRLKAVVSCEYHTWD